ncbi:MAG: hypothetical protein IPL96_08465 [Holophagaceae bacterium]|nr:hypothetical protein [Holophagaceae bacterium]
MLIAGATFPDYTAPSDPILLSDARFTVRVSNAIGIAESKAAVVTVGKATATGSMMVARFRHTASRLNNGKVFVAGGQSPDQYLEKRTEIYDPVAGIFQSAGLMLEGRTSHTATLLSDGRILLVGGTATDSGAGAEIYDPSSDTFKATGPMVQHRINHQVTGLPDGKLLISGGLKPIGVVTDRCEIFDPISNTFASTASLSTPRTDHTATVLPDGKILITGGNAGTSPYYLATSEIFNPATQTFQVSASLGTARVGHLAIALPNGTTLVKGGTTNSGQMAFPAEVYSPLTSTFTPATRPFSSTVDGTVTNLGDGLFLFVGGSGGGVEWNGVELYDSVRDLVNNLLTDLLTERRDHTSTLLSNGKILITGGMDRAGKPFSTAEVYQ